jgi:hypothetical protein
VLSFKFLTIEAVLIVQVCTICMPHLFLPLIVIYVNILTDAQWKVLWFVVDIMVYNTDH